MAYLHTEFRVVCVIGLNRHASQISCTNTDLQSAFEWASKPAQPATCSGDKVPGSTAHVRPRDTSPVPEDEVDEPLAKIQRIDDDAKAPGAASAAAAPTQTQDMAKFRLNSEWCAPTGEGSSDEGAIAAQQAHDAGYDAYMTGVVFVKVRRPTAPTHCRLD